MTVPYIDIGVGKIHALTFGGCSPDCFSKCIFLFLAYYYSFQNTVAMLCAGIRDGNTLAFTTICFLGIGEAQFLKFLLPLLQIMIGMVNR